MTKEELTKFLTSKANESSPELKKYIQEEIKTIKLGYSDWDKILDMVSTHKTLETNPNNIYSLYLLGVAPEPKKLQHHWELADLADIDLDFSPDGRDKIKEYLMSKFGEKNCVSIGTYGTLGVKGSVQEVSRAFNIAPSEYIKISTLVSDEDKDLEVNEIKEKYPQVAEFLDNHPEVAEVMTKLIGMKKNIGQHAGGFIVSSDNVFDNIPVVRANKGFVSGWQESGAVKELEALGFIKVDILGLACVEQIRRCVEAVHKNHPNNNLPKDVYLVPTDDPKVYDFINTLELDNIFQMESKIFREAVRKVKPRTLQDISNISTLVRPGAACSVDQYAETELDFKTIPKSLHKVYDHTRGWMLYQEQLLQVLMNLGGFTIFEADKVRRLVRKIGKSKTTEENRQAMVDETDQIKKKYLANAIKKIIEDDGWEEAKATEYATKQWDALMGQAKYSFNMPHSYAYSLMGYVQSYLKTYYPIEFWVATLNTISRGQEKNDQSSLGKYIHSITSASGIEVFKPDVNYSGVNFEARDGKIYFALSYVKDVSNGAEEVIKYRPYKDWDDFVQKAIENKLNKRIVRGLIFSGACDFEDPIESRPYKWLLFLTAKKENKKNKKITEEVEEYQANMPTQFDLIQIEYNYCKYSFTGLDTQLKTNKKLANLTPISERDPQKKLWVLVGYIADISTKKSKKSGGEYVLVSVTDFKETISVFAFGEAFRERILGKYHKGQLVKIGVKNDSGWLKLPWEKEYNGKFPIEVVG